MYSDYNCFVKISGIYIKNLREEFDYACIDTKYWNLPKISKDYLYPKKDIYGDYYFGGGED